MPESYMSEALALAKSQLGNTAPNPSVGCLIVKNQQIIGRGVTAKGGRPHGETIALAEAGTKANGATMYVTLEPCCHFGVTPPCTYAIIKAGISKIYIATQDSNPKVAGKGIKDLQEAGLEVITGLLQMEAIEINAGFLKMQQQQMPLVTLKLATTLDGKIALANKQSKWITGPKAREYAHKLRAENDAILVGIGTVLADNPSLTCRNPCFEDRSPIRIVLDSDLRLPLDANLFNDIEQVPLWIVTTRKNNNTKAALIKPNVKIIEINDLYNLNEVLTALADNGITRLLVEGGRQVASSFLKQNLFDNLIWITSPKIIGNDGTAAIGNLGIESMADVNCFKLKELFQLDDDIVKIYNPI